ncbi:MAG: DUF5119 domain-containing protein [Bacteroidales bacterium]
MIKQTCRNIVFLFLLVVLSSCHNKDLCPECDRETAIEVKFDWSAVSDVPEGMTVLFYNMQNELVYTFNNVSPHGQLIRIDAGNYRVACYNNDTEYVEWSGEANLDSLQVYTRKTQAPQASKKATIVLPDEELVEAPDFLCGALLSEKEILAYVDYTQIVLLKPQPLLDSYTYSVSNIENGQYVSKTAATLTGLSKRYYLGDPMHQNGIVSMTFGDNDLINNKQTAVGDMYNLGYYHNLANRNYLILYIWSPGGNLRATFDVTDQVRKAPDPHHVHIIIDTKIVVSPPIDDNDGLDPSVDEWKDIIYDVIL